jgi:hypothetical protein
MQWLRPETPGSRPDARWQCSLPVLREAPGAHLLGLRPAAHGCRDYRCRAGLRLVLPGSAAAMRLLRPDPEDRQAGDGNHAGLAPCRMRSLRGGTAASRQGRAGTAGLWPVRRDSRAGLRLPRVRPGRADPQRWPLFLLRPGRRRPDPACRPWREHPRPVASPAGGADHGRQPGHRGEVAGREPVSPAARRTG